MTALPDINTIGVPGSSTESFLQTGLGYLISVQNPDPGMIDLADIIHSITHQCRYNGHCKTFYSVGEHTIRGVKLAKQLYPKNRNLHKSFFVHDFTEAYVGDVIRPVKKHLPEFKKIEEGFHNAINQRFGITEYDEKGVYEIDNLMAMWEKRDLLPPNIHWPGMPSIDHLNLPTLVPETIEKVRQDLWMMFVEVM